MHFFLKWEILHSLSINPFLHCVEKTYEMSKWPYTSRLNKNNLTLISVFTNKFFYLIHENGNMVDAQPQMQIWWINYVEYLRMSNECSKLSFFHKKNIMLKWAVKVKYKNTCEC